ncbi:MAG: FkbM family methyltransferase [Gemmatimonadota bacterium]|nr:FkbM family methyltransferase [Gemmatimonadota bacterium]
MSNVKYLKNPGLLLKKLQWQAMYRGPRRDITVDTANGRLTFDSRDKLIGKHLYMDRGYEVDQMRRSIELLRDGGYLSRDGGGIVLDVGANIGMISIALLRFGYFERGVAFEPGPDNFRLLAHNVRQNDLHERIQSMPYALSSAEGHLELELSTYNSGDHRIRATAGGGAYHENERETVQVSVHTLDALLGVRPSFDPGAVALVWMDIQGHEGHFFEGARRFFTSHRVPVVSEFWPYGIARSGMRRERYIAIVSELFTHFYSRQGKAYGKRPIDEIAEMFDLYSGPKQVTEAIFVRDA